MHAEQLAAAFRNGRTIDTPDGPRPMTEDEVSTARRYIRRTPQRKAWLEAQALAAATVQEVS